jgi:hypothetical protein
LGVKSVKRRFDRWTDADNSFFDARTQERDPKMTAKKQTRPARGRGTSRMRCAIKFHSFHFRRRRIENMAPFRPKPVDRLHLTLKTRNSPWMDVSFMGKSSGQARFPWRFCIFNSLAP